MNRAEIYLGIAGWSLRTDQAADFPATGTHLTRYAGRYNAVEINSSFYRPHKLATYQRWAESVPAHFRFSVKLPKQLTHTQRLADPAAILERFASESHALGEKLGPWLVQLPPSLVLDIEVASRFFRELRKVHSGRVACEPRHTTWFTANAESLLVDYQVARVAADPAIMPAATEPAAAQDFVYYRLHGSPRIYYSAYNDNYLTDLAARLRVHSASAQQVWCIFDNTAAFQAHSNAQCVQSLIASA